MSAGFCVRLVCLGDYGYVALGAMIFLESAGVPIPGETALLAAAFGSAHGVFFLPWVIAIAASASILGDNLGFWMGRRLGRSWLERYGHRLWLTDARLAAVDRFFERFGPSTVAIARFVTGVRVIAAFAAGTSRMSWPVFIRYNVLGAVAWATIVSLIGYAIGRGYGGISAWFGRTGIVLAVVVPAALGAALLIRWWTRFGGSRFREWHRTTAVRTFFEAWLVVTGVCAAAVVAFAAIGEEVAENETATFDYMIRAWIQAHRLDALDPVFAVITYLGSPEAVGVFAVLAAVLLWRRRGGRVAVAAVLAPLIGLAAIGILKFFFHRSRPAGALLYPGLGYSFPSGHATGTMAVAVTLAYVLGRERILPLRPALAAAAGFSFLVGCSRIYLDVHWATDVIGGWAMGLAVASAGAAVYERLRAGTVQRATAKS